MVRLMKSSGLLAVAVCLALGPASASVAQQPLKVRIGMVTVASQMALQIGRDKGIFAKYGFDVDIKPLTSGVQANQALAADQVEWSAGGVEVDDRRREQWPTVQTLYDVCEGR